MKRAIVFLVAVAMVVTVTSVAMAGTEAGDKELQLQGSFSNTTTSESDGSSSTGAVQITFNYFIGSNFSIGGTWRGSSSYNEDDSGNESETTQNFFLGRADLYLGSATSKIMPYIGGHAGQATITTKSDGSDDSSSQGTYGFHGGLKIFSSENISWNLELDRTTYTYEEYDFEVYVDSLFVGFSYYF